MLPNFSMKSMLDAVVEYRLPELLLVPPILIRMVRDPIVDNYDLSFLRRFSSGAAPLSEEIIQLLKKKFPQTGFKQGYGMTESCSCITAHPPSHYDYKYAHAVGTICASTTVKIVREDGTECGVGEGGEIWAKGPQVVMGYLNNEQATRETFDEEGFLHTGDQGAIDEHGVVTILDRIKEMIKVKGIGVGKSFLLSLFPKRDVDRHGGRMGSADTGNPAPRSARRTRRPPPRPSESGRHGGAGRGGRIQWRGAQGVCGAQGWSEGGHASAWPRAHAVRTGAQGAVQGGAGGRVY